MPRWLSFFWCLSHLISGAPGLSADLLWKGQRTLPSHWTCADATLRRPRRNE
jgi:hypothetical protein